MVSCETARIRGEVVMVYEVFEEDDGQFVVKGPKGTVGGRWRSRLAADKYAKDLNEGKIKDIPGLYRFSLIAMIVLGITTVLFLSGMIAMLDAVDKAKADVIAEQARNAEFERDIEELNRELQGCGEDLELAWKAWDRRNGVWIRAVEAFGTDLFDARVDEMTADNGLMAQNFLSTKGCAPHLDETEIFASMQ